MRHLTFFLALSLSFTCWTQEEKKKELSGTVISAAGFTVGNITSATLDKFDTRWTQLPGYGFSVGAGFQVNHNNSWSAEADFGYERNVYVFDRADIRLELGYFVPFVDLKVAKLFSKKNSRPTFWYTKFGASYHFLNGQSLNADENKFAYDLELASSGIITFMPEVGRHINFPGNSSMQIGIVGQYSSNTIISMNLRSSQELNSAIATATGTYIGVTLKYFYGIFALGGGKSGSNGGKDPKVRVEI